MGQNRRSRFSRKTLRKDLVAGVALGVESVPDGLAQGLLAGVNPLAGLYGHLFGMVGAALFTGSAFMTVQVTGAMALIVADSGLQSRPDPDRALFTLAMMSGVLLVVAGLLKGGRLVRFVPTAVMTGFVTAVGVNIVLGQLSNFTGYAAQGGNRVTRTIDLGLNILEWSVPAVVVGAITVLIIVLLQRTRIAALGLVVAVVVGSMAAVPNPDGRRADVSRDFIGQGVGNIVSGLFRGMPVGGSMSGSTLVVTAGAASRMVYLFAGVVTALVILFASDLIAYIAMPALAGLLIVVGIGTVKPSRIYSVVKSGPLQTVVMAVTFGLTLLIPLQFAVLVGVGLGIILFVAQQSNRVRVRQVHIDADGRMRESDPPPTIPPRAVIILQPYGSLFFASAPTFERQLPAVSRESSGSAVIVRLRGTDEVGLALVEVLRRYAHELRAADSSLRVVVSEERVLRQFAAGGLLADLGDRGIYRGTEWVGEALRRAYDDARRDLGME